MGQGGRTGQHRERETPLSFHPIFIKCKFSTSCSLCVGGGGARGQRRRRGTERGKATSSLSLTWVGAPLPSAGFPQARGRAHGGGETQRAGAARILPAPRAPCDPSYRVRSQPKSREQ